MKMKKEIVVCGAQNIRYYSLGRDDYWSYD